MKPCAESAAFGKPTGAVTNLSEITPSEFAQPSGQSGGGAKICYEEIDHAHVFAEANKYMKFLFSRFA